MRNLLLALALLCFAALAGSPVQACPQMEGASATMERAAPATVEQHHSAHEAQSAASHPCQHGSTSACGDMHACCAVPVLKAPQAALHRWPQRMSYALPPPANVRAAPATSLDRPPKHNA
ncbi:MAG: hypothetical protein LCH39_02495 [Proteobacteria bacterium]|nr:hypothetical protein [Pseudomonadota bacterium]